MSFIFPVESMGPPIASHRKNKYNTLCQKGMIMEMESKKCCENCQFSGKVDYALCCLCPNSDMYLDHVDEKLCCPYFAYPDPDGIQNPWKKDEYHARPFSCVYWFQIIVPFIFKNHIATPTAIAMPKAKRTGHMGVVSPFRHFRCCLIPSPPPF